MKHVIIKFNDHAYLFTELLRQIEKFKSKIDDVQRASTDLPLDDELLEAK